MSALPHRRLLWLEMPTKTRIAFNHTYTSPGGGLEAAPRDAARHLRGTLLLALHPRVGRESLLSLLPVEVFALLLAQAAPLPPCKVHVLSGSPNAEDAVPLLIA